MHPLIENYVTSLDSDREAVVALEQVVIDAEAAAALAPNGEVIMWHHPPRVVVNVYLNTFAEVAPVLRELRKRGYPRGCEPWDADDKSWRAYPGTIQVYAHVSFSESATCRRVQVGTKEEPVYAWQCDDGSDMEEVEPAGEPAVA